MTSPLNTPKQNQDTVIYMTEFATPVGSMYGCATAKGICLLEFKDQKMLENQLKKLSHTFKTVITPVKPAKNTHLRQLETELKEYFRNTRKTFDVALHISGTAFQQSVWKMLQNIPYGHTWSYKTQALKLNNPTAVRAVAAANGQNRISIIIPCHRVIGESGHLTGYAGGLHRKKWLLDFEKW